MPNINYIIATYAGISAHRERFDRGLTPLILQKHMRKLVDLLPSTTMIHQITIVRPCVTTNAVYPDYYKIDDSISKIQSMGIAVHFVETENSVVGVSYSQWRAAYREYPEFDWYITVEDDWIPLAESFDRLLLEAWEKQFRNHTDAGYLCMWYTSLCHLKPHAAISVGVISNIAFKLLKSNVKDTDHLHQYEFSKELERAGVKVCDYSNRAQSYRILYWCSRAGHLKDFLATENSAQDMIISPIHYDCIDEYKWEICRA